MQQKYLLQKKYYHLSLLNDNQFYSDRAKKRLEVLHDYETLSAEGVNEEIIFSIIRVSRASYYRWQEEFRLYGIDGLEPKSTKPLKVRASCRTKELAEKVLSIRKKHPLFGKNKIMIILKREHEITISSSTVGRILSDLLRNNKIKRASFYTGKYEPKKRVFSGHAQRLPKGAKSQKPGDLIQVDHMTIKLDNGREVKHFQAICPITRYVVSRAYRNATSSRAASFLEFMIEQFPFPVISIQVDGGAEFRGEFEQATKGREFPLYVLPPRLPKMNAFVERMNSTVKSEFYKLYDKTNNLEAINHHLQHYNHFYNTYRPHYGLQGDTPMEYYKSLEASLSQKY
jgi:transposase InsO family protein